MLKIRQVPLVPGPVIPASGPPWDLAAWIRACKASIQETKLGDPITGFPGLSAAPSLYSLTSWALEAFLSTSESFLLGPPGLPADRHAPVEVEPEGSGVFVALSCQSVWPPQSCPEDRILVSSMARPSLIFSPPFLPHWQVSSVALSLCPILHAILNGFFSPHFCPVLKDVSWSFLDCETLQQALLPLASYPLSSSIPLPALS